MCAPLCHISNTHWLFALICVRAGVTFDIPNFHGKFFQLEIERKIEFGFVWFARLLLDSVHVCSVHMVCMRACAVCWRGEKNRKK